MQPCHPLWNTVLNCIGAAKTDMDFITAASCPINQDGRAFRPGEIYDNVQAALLQIARRHESAATAALVLHKAVLAWVCYRGAVESLATSIMEAVIRLLQMPELAESQV